MLGYVVKFEAGWCQPCKAMSTLLESLDLSDRIVAVDIEDDEGRAEAHARNIRSVPTLVHIVDGVEVARLVGSKSRQELESWFDQREKFGFLTE